MKVFVETQRCILREITAEDVQGIFDLDADPEVHRYLDPPISSIAEAMETIQYIQKQYKEHNIGRWAVIDKHSQAFIGWCGLKYETGVRSLPYYDIGYRLQQKYWGQGIATETARAAVNYGFEQLHLSEINAGAHIDNVASNKILNEKLGMQLVETFLFDNLPHHWYTLNADTWKKIAR